MRCFRIYQRHFKLYMSLRQETTNPEVFEHGGGVHRHRPMVILIVQEMSLLRGQIRDIVPVPRSLPRLSDQTGIAMNEVSMSSEPNVWIDTLPMNPPPLICQNVPADGNCGWWAAIRAGNLPFNHPQELKGYVLEFWKMNRAHILDAVCVHNVNSWTAELENNLKANGAFIDQPSWQILAWMLERDIVKWDVFRCTRTTVEGT